MTLRAGTSPLQSVAERIIARYLNRGLSQDVEIVSGYSVHANRGIDITYVAPNGDRRSVKVKPDPYFGTDTDKIGDRSLSYYRADTGSLAFEALADATTKEPGWMVDSEADDLYYYYLALAQEEDEVRALLNEPDEVFLDEILVERDDLIVMPMAEARRWFASQAGNYPPRPVFEAGKSAWYRLVPRADVQRQVNGVRIVGPVFQGLAL
jgi:hypothetical protein